MATESIHVSTLIPASPEAVYDAWLSSEQHARMTGGAARIEPQVGGSHSAWGDYISGTTLELVPGALIVQSWRTLEFPADSGDSRITVTLAPEAGQTRVTIAHTDIPEGQGAKYESGWQEHYFSPMASFFSAASAEPAAKPARKRAAAKKPAPKKVAKKGAKKAAAKKAAKKPTAKKAAKKPAAKKAAKKPAAKKAAKKPAAKKSAKKAAKKPAAKKAARKPGAKKAPAKKAGARKPAARKPAASPPPAPATPAPAEG